MSNKPKMKDQFEKEYGAASSEELQREILYQLFKSNDLSEKIRSNTNTLIIWLVIIPVLILLFYMFGDLFNQ